MAILTADMLSYVRPKRGKRVELRDDAEPGLSFRVTENGTCSWSLRYVNAAGEHRRKTIGGYPALGLTAARIEARKVKGGIATKVDVVDVERQTKNEARRRRLNTLAGLAEAYFRACEIGTHVTGDARPKRASTIKEEKRVFEKIVKRRYGDR